MTTLYCPACGYNLTGLPENRCPECGTEFDPQMLTHANDNAQTISAIGAVLCILVLPLGFWIILLVSVLFRSMSPLALMAGVQVFAGALFSFTLAKRMATRRAAQEHRSFSPDRDGRYILGWMTGLYFLQLMLGIGGVVLFAFANGL